MSFEQLLFHKPKNLGKSFVRRGRRSVIGWSRQALVRILTHIILFLATTPFVGQVNEDYLKYYSLCNKGDRESYHKQFHLAISFYDSAFSYVNYVHSFNLVKAATAASKTNDQLKATKYLKRAVLNGARADILKNRNYRKLRCIDKFQELKDSAKIFEALFKSRINNRYAREIDSLEFIDQFVIRGNKFYKNQFNIKPDTISKNKNLDSLVFTRLLNLIDEFGFPSEKNIGPDGYNSATIILHHNLRLPQNDIHIKMATNALFAGNYLPNDYAWMLDQNKEFKNEKPFFCYAIADPSKLTSDERKQIEINRYNYGVKPFQSTKIKIIGKILIQRQLW